MNGVVSDHRKTDSFNNGPPPFWTGRRLIILPAEAPPPDADGILIRIDPGGVFGTGSHPTTRLCLRVLERHLAEGARVVDLGTGTGILAIAAAKLGAADVLALDIDPQAVRAASENAAANGVEKLVRVRLGSLPDALADQAGRGAASLVLVNILARVTEELFREGLGEAVEEGGRLALSGMLAPQTPGIRACLQWHDFRLEAQEREGDWICVLAQRLRRDGQ